MIDIHAIIKRVMKQKHINAAELSRKLNIHYSTITGILDRPTIKVQKLIELSNALNYNFFKEIAEQLPYEEPENERETELLKKIEQLIEENKILKIKVEVLENVISKIK